MWRIVTGSGQEPLGADGINAWPYYSARADVMKRIGMASMNSDFVSVRGLDQARHGTGMEEWGTLRLESRLSSQLFASAGRDNKHPLEGCGGNGYDER